METDLNNERLITIISFTLPSQMAIVKSHLEEEGIEVFTKDELTVQANNLYSNAVGGVKLQVLEHDAEQAILLLKQWGYLREEEVTPPNSLVTTFDLATKELPFLNKWPVELRFIAIIGVVLLIVALVYIWNNPI